MTDAERQAATLVALEIYGEGAAAELELDEGSPTLQEAARLKRKVRMAKGALEDILAIHDDLVGWVFETYFKSSFHLKEDLMAAGKEAIIKAANAYDPTQGRTFGSYAFGFVRSAMLQEEGLDNHPVTLSQRDQARYRKVQAVRGRLEVETSGDQPITAEMIAAETGLAVEEVESLLSLTRISLDHETEDGTSAYDVVGMSDEHLVALAVEPIDTQLLVDAIYEALDKDDADLVVEVGLRGTSLSEAAATLGVSKQAVDKRVKKLYSRLRNHKFFRDAWELQAY